MRRNIFPGRPFFPLLFLLGVLDASLSHSPLSPSTSSSRMLNIFPDLFLGLNSPVGDWEEGDGWILIFVSVWGTKSRSGRRGEAERGRGRTFSNRIEGKRREGGRGNE